jgi:acylglycerol lipase
MDIIPLIRLKTGPLRKFGRARFNAAKSAALWFAFCLLASSCTPYVVPPGAAISAPEFERAGYRADDGTLLPLRVWGPNQAKVAVLGLHGFGDYSNAFDTAAMRMGAEGIRVYAFDQRGFGRSPGRGRWHGVDRLVQDAADAVRVIAARHPGIPIYILGLSMGGAIAMSTAAEHPELPLDGIALVAPAVWGRAFMPEAQRDVLYAAAHVAPWYPLSGQGLQIKPSDNLAMLLNLSHDPNIIRFARIDLIWGVTDAMDRAVAAAPKLRLPCLFLYGLKDQIIPKEPTLEVVNSVQPVCRRVAVYDQGYHMLLRDLHGDIPTDDLISWFLHPTAALPSGNEISWETRLAQK